MFTGIVEELGRVAEVTREGSTFRLTVEGERVMDGLAVDESVAVNGTCLTVVALADRRFSVDVAPETARLSNVGQLEAGERVNLERSVSMSTRLGGHYVQGHVDGMAELVSRQAEGNSQVLAFRLLDAGLGRYIVMKGYVAVDGISLTTTTVGAEGFGVALIPHTASLTTLGFRRPGDRVNIEVDIIGKYVERLLPTR
ncbi:MAG: riboflavin synthase [Chloroflexota bacterium]